MTGPINTNQTPVRTAPLREPIDPDMAEMVEAIKSAQVGAPKDEAVIGAAPPPPPPAKDVVEQAPAPATAAPAPPKTKTLLVEMQIPSELMDSGAMNDLEPVFVKASDKNNPVVAHSPKVLNAFEEPPAPDGSVNFPAAVPVLQKVVDSGEIQNFHAALVPNDAAPSMPQSELNQKLQDAYDKGHDEALPQGMVPKLADSAGGAKYQMLNNLGGQMIGEVGGQFASSSLSGIWKMLPMNVAVPMALAAAPLQTFGPNGHLKVLKDIKDQEAFLQVKRDQEHKDKINLAVGPQGTLVPTAVDQPIEETLKNLHASEVATKVKLAGSGALAAAGVAALIGGTAGLAAPVLATGAMLAPIGAGLVSQKRQMQALKEKKAELLAAQAAGQTTTKVPTLDANGNVGEVDKPITEQLEGINKQIKMTKLMMSLSVTAGGVLTAVAAGVPLMFALGGLAIPAAIGVALFPKETFEFVKSLPEKTLHAFQAIGRGIAHAFNKIFHRGQDKAGELAPGGDAEAASPAVKKLKTAFSTLQASDPEQATRLQSAVEKLNTPPQNEEQLKAYQAAAADLNGALEELGKKNPEAVADWKSGMEDFRKEQVEHQQAALNQAVSDFLSGPGKDILGTKEVETARQSTGLSEHDAEQVLELMARTQLSGDASAINDLVGRAGQGDQDAAKRVELGNAIGTAIANNGALAHPAAPAQPQAPAPELPSTLP